MKKSVLCFLCVLMCLFLLACNEEKHIAQDETDSSPVETTLPVETGCPHTSTVSIPEILPTCFSVGKTEGLCCADCGIILTEQQEVPVTEHTYTESEVLKYPTHTEEGLMRSRCSLCKNTLREPIPKNTYDGSMGSAGHLTDKTIIISVFANDSGTSWNSYDPRDIETADTMLTHLTTAVEWITARCLDYGVQTSFVYNWKECPDLRVTLDFGNTNMVRSDGGGYYQQKSTIDTYIESDRLKYKYGAQNILYILYFNTDESNTVRSWALSDKQKCDAEVINAFVRRTNNYVFPASSCAHEILHLFGAYDLYYASDTITQAYVDHCRTTGSKDIMYTTSLGNTIDRILSPLDAYYIGLTDSCDEIEQWGLGKGYRYGDD